MPAGSGQQSTRACCRILLPLPGRCVRVSGEHGPRDRPAQLPGRQVGCVRQHRRLHRRSVRCGECGHPRGDDLRLGQVDPPGGQRRPGSSQRAGQIQGQANLVLGGPAGQRQRRGHLIGDELAQPPRYPPRGGGRAAIGRAAADQLGHRGQLTGRRPRGHPPPGPQHPHQLIVADLAEAVVRVSGESGQRQARGQHVQHPAVGEPGPVSRSVPLPESGRPRLRPGLSPEAQRPRRGGRAGDLGGQCVQLRAIQPGQLGRAVEVRVPPAIHLVVGWRDVLVGQRGQRGLQDLFLRLLPRRCRHLPTSLWHVGNPRNWIFFEYTIGCF